jgi:uncharacterized protein (DUF983 family)
MTIRRTGIETFLQVLIILVPIVATVVLLRRMTANDHDPRVRTVEQQQSDQVDDNRFWTLLRNALALRCPVCKQGNIFPGWFKLTEHCPHCGVRIIRAQGYMLGSIYFNYGITGVIELVVFVIAHFVLEIELKPLLIILCVFGATFPLLIFPYGRAIWLAFDQYFMPRQPNSDDGV